MEPTTLALFLALGATLIFSTSSLVFTEYSRRVSVLWMNAFKAFVAFVLLLITIPLVQEIHRPDTSALFALFLSGLVGLNIGDLFLLNAFTRLGAARTLILFGFSPLLVGVGAWVAFDQSLDPSRFIAVIFLIGCLLSFSLERYQTERRWEATGLAFALIGVTLDAVGILLTRFSFETAPILTPLEGHLYRCIGALVGFAVIGCFRPIGLISNFQRWDRRSKMLIIAGSVGGTFLSLILFLTAIKIGHLASVTAIGITGPMFATLLECLWKRQWPSRYLIAAILFFIAGFYTLTATAPA